MQERARAYVGVIARPARARLAARELLFCPSAVRTTRSCIRGLRLSRITDAAHEPPSDDDVATLTLGQVHARSRFRSVRHPERFAMYSLHESGPADIQGPGDHRLVVVREFRRVPLRTSALGLVVFAARAGREAAVVAALAHFAERAVSLYQPPYLLLARSLEQPGITVLLTAVRVETMLEGGGATPFSVDGLLPEIAPLLAVEPEWYAYSPSLASDSLVPSVSPV